MSALETTIEAVATGAMLRHQAGRQMFCGLPECGAVLDGAKAVSVDYFRGNTLAASRMFCADCHDRNRARIVRAAKSSKHTAKFTDGRLLDGDDIVRRAIKFRIGVRISAMVATRPEGSRKKAVVWKRVKGRRIEFVGADVPEVIARQDWIVHRSTRGRRMTVTHIRAGLAAATGESLRGALLTAAGRFLRAEPETLAGLFEGIVSEAPAP